MIFYSSVAIIIGVLLIGVGVFYLVSKKEKDFISKKSHLRNAALYLKISGVLMTSFGTILASCGVTSFIVNEDLVFSIVFSILIVGYLLTDYIVQKKLTIK